MKYYNSNQPNASSLLSREYQGGDDMILIAIGYAREGYKIFPCINKGKDKKKPLIKDWPNVATNDLKQINEWWTKWPNAAIGLPTGAINNIWVVDCDIKNDGNGIEEFLKICKENDYNPNDTLIIVTPTEGLHYYYRYEVGKLIKTSVKEIGIDIDVRGDGGYIIGAKSLIDGKAYRRLNENDIQKAPSWLTELCRKKELKPKIESNSVKYNFEGNIDPRFREKFEEAINAVRGSQDGSRNDTLNKSAFLCGQLVGAELLNESFARDELEEASMHLAYTDGLNSVQATIKSGLEKGKLNPYQLYTNKPIEKIENPRQQHEWNEPIAFDGVNYPRFTTDNLPPVIGDFISALAEELQTAIEVPYAMTFATISIASQGKFIVKVRENYEACLNLYIVAPALPSTGKSSVVARCKKPIINYQHKIRKDAEERRLEIESEHKTQKMLIEKKRKEVEREIDIEKIKEIKAEVIELEKQLPKMIPTPLLLVDDVTPEKLGRLMCENNGCMGILEAEGDLFSMIAGRYQKAGDPNMGLYLKAFTIEPYSVQRVTQPPILLTRPCLAIGLTPQPIALEQKEETFRAFRERGLHARFDYFLSESKLGHRKIEPAPMPKSIEDRFYSKITQILEMPFKKDETGNVMPYVLTLDTEAKTLFFDFKRQVESYFLPNGKLEHMPDWGGKSDGKVLKYAGLLHISTTDEPNINHVITANTMSIAIDITHKLIEHSIAAYASMNIPDNIRLAKRILKWIQRHEKSTFTFRDCQQSVKNEHIGKNEINNALSELIDREYIIRLKDTMPTSGGTPTQNYQSNFKIFI